MNYLKRDKEKTILFTIASETTKILLGIKLTKEMKDLYIENYNTQMIELKKIVNNGKRFHVHGIGRNSYC